MKVAISVTCPIFETAGRLAKQRNMPSAFENDSKMNRFDTRFAVLPDVGVDPLCKSEFFAPDIVAENVRFHHSLSLVGNQQSDSHRLELHSSCHTTGSP